MLDALGFIGGLLLLIVIVVLATALFMFINRIFKIYFFGFTGIFMLWFGCALVTGYVVFGITEFVVNSAATIGSIIFQIIRFVVVGAIWISAIVWIINKFRGTSSDKRDFNQDDESEKVHIDDKN